MATDDRTEATPEILGAQFLRTSPTAGTRPGTLTTRLAQVASLCTDDVEWQQSSTPPLPAGHAGATVVVQQLHRAFPDFRFAVGPSGARFLNISLVCRSAGR